jgi:hypothetical protein
MKERLIVLPFVLILFAACQEPNRNVAPHEAEEMTPDEIAGPYMDRADEAMRALQSGLVQALTTAIAEGGPGSAVNVCRDEAREIAAGVARETDIAVGRTSHRLRNPRNASPSWAEAVVQQTAGRKIKEVQPHVFDLGDRIAVLKPIGTVGLCVNCHGKPSEIEEDVKQALAEAYPNDRATGFSAGDLRGWMWAEVAK